MRNKYLFFAFIFFAVTVNAQQIYIQEPIVNQLGCTSIPDLYAVSVNNFQSSTVQCAMEVEISYTGNALQKGLVAKGSLTGAPIFNLPPGLTRFLPSNINQFFPTRNLQFFDNNLKQINEQSACLPAGQYDICITLYGVDNNGQIKLQNQLSKTCYKVTKENNNAIILISPVNNEKVKMALPVFAWSPIANFSKTSNYIIEIVEVLDGQTAFEAFRQNPIYFSESGLKSNSFQYPIKARQLTPCINYAWRVGYYEEFGFNNPGFNVPIKPSLYSEIWALSFQCDNTKNNTKSNLNASRLIKPAQSAKLESNSGLNFTWTEITPAQSYDITYVLRVVEKTITQTALQAFTNNSPVLSVPVVNNVFYYWPESAQYLDKTKTYVWGIIPYNNAQEQLIDNFFIEKNTFNFKGDPVVPKDCPLKIQNTRVLSQTYNKSSSSWEVKLMKPIDNSNILLEQLVEHNFNGETIYLAPLIGEFEILSNNPSIDIVILNESATEINISIKSKTSGKDISTLGNIELCAQRRYGSGDFNCLAKTCTNAQLVDKIETQPQLTKMQAMQGFPKLNPDKTALIKMDIASDVNQFPGWQIQTKQFELLPQDNNVKLEIIAANDNTFTYTVLLKDKTTLQTIDLTDVELPINLVAKYKYEFLKRDNSGSLISMSTKDTTRVIPLSEFVNSDRPKLTKMQAMQGFPKLNPNKTALIKMDIASNVDQFPGWQIQTKQFELLPQDNNVKLEKIAANDNTFTYTVLLKDKTTLQTIDLKDVELPINLVAKYKYEFLKRDNSGSLISMLTKDTTQVIPLSDFENSDKPKLTKIQAMQGFPKLSPDKTALIKMDITSNIDQFPGWQIQTKQFELHPQDNNVKLEIIAANDNTFTYTVLLKDKTTLQTIDLKDVELPINLVAKYKYEFLKRDNSGSLISMSTKDTTRVIPLSEFENSNRPKLTKMQAMQGFPKLNPDKTALIKMDIASNVDQFPGWQIRTKKFEMLPKDKSMKLEIVNADDKTFAYTTLLKDITTLKVIELADQKLPIELMVKYEYELLKREDAGSLISMAILDTVAFISLSDFDKEDCILTISKLRLPTPYEYVSNATYKNPNNKDQITKYWKLQLNQDTKVNKKSNAPLPKYYQGAKKVDFTTVTSNVPLTFIEAKADGPFGGSFYIIDPDWAAIGDDGNNPNKAYWEVKICMTIPLYKDVKGNETDFRKLPVECEATECIIIKHNEKLLDAAKEAEKRCQLEITNFSIANTEPIFREDNVPNTEHPDQYLKDFFQYNFRTSTNLDEINAANNNIYSANEFISFEILESNIGLAQYDMGGANAHALQPIWETSSFFGKNKVFYKAKVCYTVEFYEGDALYCVDSKCEDISYQGKSVQNMLSNSCLLAADFTFKKNNELVTFYPTLENHIPDSTYSYQWIFSDGQTTTGDSTINLFTSLDNAWAKLIVTGRDENGKWCVSDTIKKNLKVIPNCDFQACYTPCGSLVSSLKVDDEVNLCGQLIMKITSVSGSGAGFTGKGIVRIPWLLSDIEVEFTDIKINTSMEFCSGEINAVKYDNAPQLPQQLAINAGVAITQNQIDAVNNFVNNINVKQIPDDAVIDAAQNAVNTLRIPIGFTNFDPQSEDTLNKTNFTLAIGAITFKPGQNFIRAFAGVTLNDPDIGTGAQQLLFQSDNFFFNAAKPIYNTGDPLDLKFKILRPTTLKYGTNNGDPIYLTFNDDSKKDTWGGTQLSLESDCNTPYRLCLKADIDIEMPKTWLVQIDDNDTTKVKANAKIEMCDFKDIITQVSLPKCKLPNTAGCELEVQQLTWDQSSTRNADSFAFPANYNQTGISEDLNEFKGFFLKSAQLILPEGLVKNDNSRIEINLSNWIFHKGFGVTGSIVIKPNISFPNMNVSDLGASIDSFKMEWVNSSLKQAYLKGEITLPVADYAEDNTEKSMNKLVYKAMFGSYPTGTIDNGILFQVSPKNGLNSDFFGKGTLDIKPTSNLYVSFTRSATSIDFVMDGKIDWPNKQVGPINLDMELGFEQIKLNYSKPRGGDRGTFLFDHGVWSFASPEKKLNKFPISIKNFRPVTRNSVGYELFVGGIGFDLIINLNENIGGQAGINILGAISKLNGKLKPKFKLIELSSVKVYADLPGVKLDGSLNLYNEDPIMGNGFAAEISAKFKMLETYINASVIFGNTTYNNENVRYRYWKAEALAIFSPGVPFLPGIAFRGAGLGAYKNMNISMPEKISIQSNTVSTFSGAVFTPNKGSWGFKFKAIVSTTPKEEGFNGDLGFEARWSPSENGNSSGISYIGIDGQLYSGCSILERNDPNKTIIWGNVTAGYNFVSREFGLTANLNLNRPPITGNVNLDIKANASTGRWHFMLGRPDSTNTLTVNLAGVSVNTNSYFMFGNNIPQPPIFTTWAQNEYNRTFPEGNSLNSSNIVNNNSVNSYTLMGTGFAFGVGAGVNFDTDKKKIVYWPIQAWGYATIRAGFEINASLLKYNNYLCPDYGRVGINGWRASASVIAWAQITIGGEACGRALREEAGGAIWDRCVCDDGCRRNFTLLDLRFGAWLAAQFPNPTYFAGGIDAQAEILGFGCSVSRNFEYGTNCSGGQALTATPSGIQQQDAAEAQRVQLIKELTPENNTTGVKITQPLTAKYGFVPNQVFDVPEQQANGEVKVKTFKAFYLTGLTMKTPASSMTNVPLEENLNILNEYEYYVKRSPVLGNNVIESQQSKSRPNTNHTVSTNQNTSNSQVNNGGTSGAFQQRRGVVNVDVMNENLSPAVLAQLGQNLDLTVGNQLAPIEVNDYVDNTPSPQRQNSLEKQTDYKFMSIGLLLEKGGGNNQLPASATVSQAIQYFRNQSNSFFMLAYLSSLDPNEVWGGWEIAKNRSGQQITQQKISDFKTEELSQTESLNQAVNRAVVSPPASQSVNRINP
jgi:hypothetical protein